MSDLTSRLRSEASTISQTAGPDLVTRICAAVPAHRVRTVDCLGLPWPRLLAAAAAVLAVASGSIWLFQAGGSPEQVAAPTAAVMRIPAAPALDDLLAPARTAMPATGVPGEIAALQADLAMMARTVRGAIPF